tara:strand:- start:263 stop:907 length:645 start_codon:yes stop_codon:yes gene_type:complete
MNKYSSYDRDLMSPKDALQVLVEGNTRFVNNDKRQYDMLITRNETKDKQQPFASILGCSDSRASVEFVFDQNLGDLFSVRLAGNIASKEAVGSLEFSTKYLGSKIIVVMGHTNCGAIKAACDQYHEGNIGEIIRLIEPAVAAEKSILSKKDRGSHNEIFVEKVCFHNIQYQIDQILKQSSIIRDQLKEKKVGLIGAIYNLSTGIVEFDLDNAQM